MSAEPCDVADCINTAQYVVEGWHWLCAGHARSHLAPRPSPDPEKGAEHE